MPMHVFSNECLAKAHLPIKPGAASLLQVHPGAGVDGIDKFKPFQYVLKDGFFLVGCVKDYMYWHGDKFGDNKHDYKLDGIFQVSIVHYDAFVDEKDREEMTQTKCFEFCRTVPDMGFFGLVNGRDCYCAPFYTAMESDDTQCDEVCEGDNTATCGGTSKSSIFAMHMCESVGEDLEGRSGNANDTIALLNDQVKLAKGLSEKMQSAAAKFQTIFGAVGDSVATGHMQEAKVFAGDLVHKAEDAAAVSAKLGKLVTSASSLKNFKDSKDVIKAERIMEDIDDAIGESEALSTELSQLTSSATAEVLVDAAESWVWGKIDSESFKQIPWGDLNIADSRNPDDMSPPKRFLTYMSDGPCDNSECDAKWQALKTKWQVPGSALTPDGIQMAKGFRAWPSLVDAGFVKRDLGDYYPVMYFVDKEFESLPSTCTGAQVGKPIVGESAQGCAAKCDANVHSCVGFQYFQDRDDKLCFLLSGFSAGVYYTGCGRSFLQAKSAPFQAKCLAKFSSFKGTTLKPNPSGTCEQCFKDLKKADRCY